MAGDLSILYFEKMIEHGCHYPSMDGKEQLKAMLASWLQEFLAARGRSMWAWEEAFSGVAILLVGTRLQLSVAILNVGRILLAL